jgi:hypothetical protein
MKTPAIFLLLILWLSTSYVFNADIKKLDDKELRGTWKFTYIELFDWNKLGIPTDSMEVDIHITFSKHKFAEELISTNDGFVRKGKWIFDDKTNTITGTYVSQTNNNEEKSEPIKGFLFKMEILKLDKNKLEINHHIPESDNHEFAIPGYGKCVLKRIK